MVDETTGAASRRLVVAVDGPSGSGKSSVSREVARRLGAAYLDTGAMYRAVAWHCREAGVLEDDDAVVSAVQDIDLGLSVDPDVDRVVVGTHDITEAIRAPGISAVVSVVATNRAVRELLVARQRELIDSHRRIVAEGRDITTVVAPDADARILLTASAEVRLARRGEQLGGTVGRQDLTAQVVDRDAKDSTVVDFMTPAAGVGLVDSSELDLESTVQAVLAEIAGQSGQGVFGDAHHAPGTEAAGTAAPVTTPDTAAPTTPKGNRA
ncbi:MULTISPECIES: (d)CMP kinase [Micrococcaceae]|uniref:(d)CMP kinase n=1 Tax=Micrococcaceae TaxID=1268 RepID=UPI00161DA20C|nr:MULTISPECIES: (d)CMP kinase [Micrococcaceae]MBB5749240.1 cytidylate kinase [Micrococcus sp. TA1]HRO29439.1 (d)CMP kinase [Citricoccus sp.]HRO93058.1 (d)CMP kinase [Citricoccus sp.]